MSTADDIVDGVVCMKCMEFLIADDGTVCDAGHLVYCKSCWKQLPKRWRDDGAPYFDERSGQINTGE